MEERVINKNRPLIALLRHANNDELGRIADIITDNGDGRVSLDNETCKTIQRHRAHGVLGNIAETLEAEIYAFGGNSFYNRIRSKPISYDQIAKDAAKKIGAKYQEKSNIYDIELEALRTIMERSLQKKNSNEIESILRDSGCKIDQQLDKLIRTQTNIKALTTSLMAALGPYYFARLLAEAMAPTLIRPALAGAGMVIGPAVLRAPAILNPLGLALTALFVGYDLSGPAYRVTIPIMINIAMIRQRIIASDKYRLLKEFQECL